MRFGSKILKIVILIFVLQIASTSSFAFNIPLFEKPFDKAEVLESLDAEPGVRITDISDLIDTPYEMAARYMPVLEKALGHFRVPFKAKKLYVERYVYNQNSKPAESMKININIARDGLLGQMITAEGKLNDWDLDYTNHFKFSIFGKGTMEVRAKLDGKPFVDLNVFANKKTHTTNVQGKLFDKETSYLTKTSNTNGSIGGFPYAMSFESIKDDNNEVVRIISKGKIGDYHINGVGNRVAKDRYEIEEHYGPLLIKTTITVLG